MTVHLILQGQDTESIRNLLEVTQRIRGNQTAQAAWPGAHIPSFHVIPSSPFHFVILEREIPAGARSTSTSQSLES